MIISPLSLEAQITLNKFYLREMVGAESCLDSPINYREYHRIYNIENQWMCYEANRCDLDSFPDTPQAFEAWYYRLHKEHRAAVAPFFEHLANNASLLELAFYICLEGQVDGRFDDVIALAQIGVSDTEKLALAENYWDEMGCGDITRIHTRMFSESAQYMSNILKDHGIAVASSIPSSALKNGNILMLLALRRRYALRLLGSLSILEHTAPWRFLCTTKGLRRLGVPPSAVDYHEMHISIDAKHGNDLIKRVIRPMLSRRPELCREIAYGCAIRFNIAKDYYDGILSATEILGISTFSRDCPSSSPVDDFKMSADLHLSVEST